MERHRKFVFFPVLVCFLIISMSFAQYKVTLVEERRNEIVLNFTLSHYQVRDVGVNGELCNYIYIPGVVYPAEKGLPDLPRISESIRIHNNTEMSLEIVDIQYNELAVKKLVPSKGMIYRSQNPADVPYEFGELYRDNVWYPQIAAYLGKPYILREVRGIEVYFQPISYNPALGKIKVAESITVKIKNTGIGKTNVLNSVTDKISPTFDKIYNHHFINYAATRTRYPAVGDGDKMIVISPSAFSSNIQPFIDWKNKKGIKTTLYLYPTATGTGETALKQFIQGKYDTEHITYILLVGDHSDIPAVSWTNGGNTCESDPSYVLLAGSDRYADAFIGRFSSSTAAEITAMVNKVIKYESQPDPAGLWYDKGCGIASDQGTPADKEWMDKFRDTLMKYNYSSVDQIYDPGATAAQVSTALNDGRSWVDYMGQGSYSVWGTSDFALSNVTSLTNGDKLPIILNTSCYVGQFKQYTCLAEMFTKSANKGAIIFLGASNSQAWKPPQDGQMEMISLLCQENYISAGAIIYNGMMKMVEKYSNNDATFEGWILFGDPSLMPFTKKPTALNATYPTYLSAGSQKVTIGFGESGLDGRVCLYHPDSGIVGSAIVSNAGMVEIDAVIPAVDSIILVITARNRVPFQAVISTGNGLPVFATHPQSATVTLGDPATFTITANGPPVITYQWEKKQGAGAWTAITGETGTTYSIPSVSYTDTGSYRVVATNGAGSVNSNTAVLTIRTIPIITAHPSSDTAIIYQSLQFTVVADGNPTPQYKWLKNGVLISGTSSTYSIPSVQLVNAGIYRAVAWNSAGSDTSDTAYLVVWDTTNTITTHPKNDTVLAGQQAQLYIKTTGTDVTYQWQKLVGSNPVNVNGETNDTLRFVVTAGDDGTQYRCITTAYTVSDTSSYASVIIGAIPQIISFFPADTVIRMNGSIALAAASSAIPAPAYAWFFISPLTGTPVSKGTDVSLILDNTIKADSGYYYYTATNKFGIKNSDTVFIHVLKPVQISTDLSSTYTVLNGSSASFSVGAQGDGALTYSWYKNGTLISGQCNASYSINPVDSVTHHNTRYHCIVTNSLFSAQVGTAASAVCTLLVSKFYNPFKVKAERVSQANKTEVSLKIWGDGSLATFPSILTGTNPWADSVWVIYKTRGYATSASQASVKKFSITDIKSAVAGGDSLKTSITVGQLPFPNDSCFWFNYSVYWRIPGGKDTLIMPYTQANKVFMYDTTATPNPLSISGYYIDKSDTAALIVGNIGLLQPQSDSVVTIQCSRFAGFSPLLYDKTLSVTSLQSSGNIDTLLVASLGQLPIETDSLHFRWHVKGKNGLQSNTKQSTCVIGWPRPVYNGSLHADSTNWGSTMHLSWDDPSGGADSIRIWYNTDTIPLEHAIGLPLSQAHYVGQTGLLFDTINGLTNNTNYFFGLQLYRNMMWSYITEQSRTGSKTAVGDTTHVVNIIGVDTAWYCDTVNAIKVFWHIDLSGIPGGYSAQSAYSVSMDSALLNINPMSWNTISSSTNITVIPLGSGVIFDATYHAGLWLRLFHESIGPGQAAAPTNSSKVPVRLPKITWQTISLSSTHPDTVEVFNGTVIIQTITPFAFSDTLRLYTRPTELPQGMVELGGTGFEFSNKNASVPPFRIGMKYHTQKSVTKDLVSIYNDAEGLLYNNYGSSAGDSSVWSVVSTDNIKYPFLVLADTAAPAVSFDTTTTDTGSSLVLGDIAPLDFILQDNIANVQWKLMYGKGNQPSEYVNTDTLDALSDTVKKDMYISNGYDKYGFRGAIIVTDGIHCDTVDISRRVTTLNTDSLYTEAFHWLPLRATASLTNSSLAGVLNEFNNTQGAWEYDKTRFRVARWYDTTGGSNASLVEYSPSHEQDFSLSTGRIVWLKSAQAAAVNFGPGLTSPLKDAFALVLPGRTWSDFALPYKFAVKIKDILTATGQSSDSLVFYRWLPFVTSYAAIPVYIPALDSTTKKDTATIQYQPHYDAYTVYNRSLSPIVLRIPSIPAALSYQPLKPDTRRPEQERTVARIWDVSLEWSTESGGRPQELRLGCDNSKSGDPLYGTPAPSFGSVQVGVSDGARQAGGYAVYHNMDKGGAEYEIAFTNQEKTKQTLHYRLNNLFNLPRGMKAKIYNPQTGRYDESNTGSIALAANNSDRRWVVIGDEDYINGFAENKLFSRFSLLGAYPNPFRGRVTLRYAVPWYGVKKISLVIYDIRGRALWRRTISRGIERGVNTLTWDMASSDGQYLSSGVYMLRMQVYENGKNGVSVYKKKMTCLR